MNTVNAVDTPLGVYLNDHLAGATAGLGLARRMARTHRGRPTGTRLAALARDVERDRESLASLMAALGVPRRRHRVLAGWLGERAGLLKTNGRLLRRSPVSDVLELEAMRLGVEGKAAGWRLLRELAGREPRLDVRLLEGLLSRAAEQSRVLEELRLAAARGWTGRGGDLSGAGRRAS